MKHVGYLLVLATMPVVADTVRVPLDFPTIQAAIDGSSEGDTILVADGVYTGPGNREIQPRQRGHLIRSENGPANCIIDCQGAGRGFSMRSGETRATRVEGFTIRNGDATRSTSNSGYGSGILISGTSPEVVGCVIESCGVLQNGTRGGGIWVNGGAPLIDDCLIRECEAWEGGGVYLDTCGPAPRLVILESEIRECTAREGGGIWLSSNCVATGLVVSTNYASSIGGGAVVVGGVIAASDVTLNQSSQGGGAYLFGGSSVLNCYVHSNSAIGVNGGRGGGLYVGAGLAANTLIASNTAWNDGGGVFVQNSANLQSCTITANLALFAGGGLAVDPAGNLLTSVRNTVIWANDAAAGGQVAVLDTSTTGLVRIGFSNVEGGPEAAFAIGDPNGQILWGLGNIEADPLFVNAVGGDYHLLPGSPCIDAGQNGLLPLDVADLDNDGEPCEPLPIGLGGMARQQDDPNTPDSGFGAAPVIDIGAYEFGAALPLLFCPGDTNGDGSVDLSDLAVLLSNFGLSGGAIAENGNFDCDQDVDLSDLAILLGAFGEICP